jgi:hypothetical protein
MHARCIQLPRDKTQVRAYPVQRLALTFRKRLVVLMIDEYSLMTIRRIAVWCDQVGRGISRDLGLIMRKCVVNDLEKNMCRERAKSKALPPSQVGQGY